MKKIFALAMTLLNWKDLSSQANEEGKINLTDEERKMLRKAAARDDFDQIFEKEANTRLANDKRLEELTAEQKQAQEQLTALLAEAGIEEAGDDAPKSGDEDGDDVDAEGKTPSGQAVPKPEKKVSIEAQIGQLRDLLAKQSKEIEKLSSTPEPDNPVTQKTPMKALQHSATHLFASGKSWDSYDNRPWNARLRDHMSGINIKAAEYSEFNIDRIITDFHEYTQDINRVISFIRGLKRIPGNWGRISNIDNELIYAKLFMGEITQGRKKKWMPKGLFEFQPERGKVYPTQIDLSFEGYDLQRIESNWMNKFNKEGASPFKMSFVEFLLTEVFKKQAEEDDISLVRGVHFPTADDATSPGQFIHRMNGFLKLAHLAQLDRKYLAFSLGIPTNENIYDYVETMVKTVPKYWRDLPGMVMYMDIDKERAYHKKRELLKGTMPTYEPGKMTVDHYENIRIVPMYGIGDFIAITPADNIDVLEGRPGESSQLSMQKEKRDLNIFGDYKLGVHVYAFGYEWPAGTTMTAEKQMFFSNDVPLLEDVWITALPNATVLSAKYHNAIQTGVNTGATAITDIIDVPDGSTVTLYGNTGTASTIANGGNFDLQGSITLSENIYIKLKHRTSDDKLVEILRGNLVTETMVVLEPDATTADAALGSHFLTSANTVATALTDIENAEEGVTYRIEGGSATNATTIAASGNFSRISGAVTLNVGVWIDVVWNGSVFVEVNRSV